MTSDQNLQEKAYHYLQSELETSENFEDTLRYFYFLRDSIDQYIASIDQGEEDYPGLL